MLWGSMSTSGVGNLQFIDTNMNKFGYLTILNSNVKESAMKLGLGPSSYFQQANDPKLTTHIVQMWLLHNTPKRLKPSPPSKDLNPIENLWWELEKQVHKHKVSNKSELKLVLEDEWQHILPSVIRKYT